MLPARAMEAILAVRGDGGDASDGMEVSPKSCCNSLLRLHVSGGTTRDCNSPRNRSRAAACCDRHCNAMAMPRALFLGALLLAINVCTTGARASRAVAEGQVANSTASLSRRSFSSSTSTLRYVCDHLTSHLTSTRRPSPLRMLPSPSFPVLYLPSACYAAAFLACLLPHPSLVNPYFLCPSSRSFPPSSLWHFSFSLCFPP